MKNIITIVALMITGGVYGQKKDTALKSVWTDATGFAPGNQHFFDDYRKATPTNEPYIGKSLKWTISNDSSRRLHEFTITPKYDIVKVIMLVCDTSLPMGSITTFLAGTQYYGVYWKFGYEVLEIHEPQGLYNPKYEHTYHTFKEYLDENKKPLSKRIIVWLTK